MSVSCQNLTHAQQQQAYSGRRCVVSENVVMSFGRHVGEIETVSELFWPACGIS
jgi:hypothetical protein